MKASLFDLDHTLLRINCSYRFGAYLYRQHFFSFFTMLRLVSLYASHKIGLLSMQKLHRRIFDLIFRGRPFSSIEPYIEPFLEKELASSFYPPAMKKLKEAIQEGHLVALLSSSPDFLIRAIAKRLNISEWRATVYALDKQGVFCDIPTIVQGSEKAAYVESLPLPKRNVTAYSDSHLDLPFLQAAGVAVAVSPNKKLRRIGKRHHWEII